MARTGQRYRDQEAAQLCQHAQTFANYAYQHQLFDQWIFYNNISFGKLIITDRHAQVLFKPHSRQLPIGHVRTHSLIMTI